MRESFTKGVSTSLDTWAASHVLGQLKLLVPAFEVYIVLFGILEHNNVAKSFI